MNNISYFNNEERQSVFGGVAPPVGRVRTNAAVDAGTDCITKYTEASSVLLNEFPSITKPTSFESLQLGKESR